MFSTKSFSLYTNPLVTVPRSSIAIGITVTFMFHSVFNSLARSRYLSFIFLPFDFTLWTAGIAKFPIRFSFFFVDYYKVKSSSQDQVIHLYLKIPNELVSLIFQSVFWVVHIPFIHMDKFQFLAQFPMDHLAHPVVSSLILFLYLFAAFAYVINRLVSITTLPTYAILLRLINSCFHPNGIVLCCY